MYEYEAVGRFSEKNCESYMLVLDKQKELLRGVPQIESRVNLVQGREQVMKAQLSTEDKKKNDQKELDKV